MSLLDGYTLNVVLLKLLLKLSDPNLIQLIQSWYIVSIYIKCHNVNVTFICHIQSPKLHLSQYKFFNCKFVFKVTFKFPKAQRKKKTPKVENPPLQWSL